MLPSLVKFALQRWADRPDRWDPLLAVHYLTYACDFRCPYCSDGAGRPYYRQENRPLPAERSLELLQRIRRETPYLVLTGGEPLRHPGVDAILTGLPALGYRSVVFTTNGYELDAHLEAVAPAVTELVVSVDTLDPARADACYGKGDGALDRILDNVERARALPGRPFELVFSLVLRPEWLDDAEAVCRYAWDRDIRVAACPQLVGVKAHPELPDDPRYRRFYDFLIAEKRRGRPVHGAVPYLERMRDLPWFRCRPFTMLVVDPAGEVFYPCLERNQLVGNLLDAPDLHTLRREGTSRFGPQPLCDVRCHSACALGFATLFDAPLSAVEDLYLESRGRLRRALTGRR